MCHNFERENQQIEETMKQAEEGNERIGLLEVLEEAVKTFTPVVKGCLAGGTYGAYELSFVGQPEAGAVIGCAAGGAVNYLAETNGFP